MQQTTLRKYEEMRDVLPPEAMAHNEEINVYGFLVGEAASHRDGLPTYDAYFHDMRDETCAVFDSAMTRKEFLALMNDADMLSEALCDQEDADGEEAIELTLSESYDQEAIDAYIKNVGEGYLDNFEEAYSGQFDSDEDFAQDMAEQLDLIKEDATWPNNCIDWEYAARELMYDYFESDGYYFRNI